MVNWSILGITADTDIQGIKLAYATKLKDTRPDQHPEQFKQLHFAYKQALATAKSRRTLPTINPVVAERVPDDLPTDSGNSSHSEDVVSTNQYQQVDIQANIDSASELIFKEEPVPLAREISDVEEGYNILLRKASDVISVPEKRNQLSEWQFLIESPFILEPWVHGRLGIHVFNEIYRINTEARSGKRTTSSKRKRYLAPDAEVRKSTVEYLNEIFHWSAQQNQLRFYVEPAAHKFVFSLLPEVNSNVVQQKSIQAVKGGQVIQTNIYKKESALDRHIKKQEAAERIKELSVYSLSFIMVILFLFVLAELYSGKLFTTSVFALAFISVGVFSTFVLKENKYAFYLMWPYATLLLFIFPIGTYVGGSLLYHLVLLKGKDI
jgi:hypothetical protein